jgi:hypothetical protein
MTGAQKHGEISLMAPEQAGTKGTLRARDFIVKWPAGTPAHALGERAGAQAHFIDLCQVLGVPEPADPEHHCFERALTRTGSGSERRNGFADVWLRGRFAWAYKAPGKSLDAALRQLMMCALPLESPPLLVVSDRQRIEMHTHFSGPPSERHVFALDDIHRPEVQQRLRALWTAPDSYKPQRNNRDITEEAARTFASTADRLHTQLQALFAAMGDGSLFGVDDIPWFNGGLFKTIDVPALAAEDVTALKAASALNWSAIDPSIFGTLFERGLDPSKRSQRGAHYNDPATINRLVAPGVQQPLLAAWQSPKAAIAVALAKSKKHGDKAWRDAQAAFAGYLETLRGYRVLDPACSSGNFCTWR